MTTRVIGVAALAAGAAIASLTGTATVDSLWQGTAAVVMVVLGGSFLARWPWAFVATTVASLGFTLGGRSPDLFPWGTASAVSLGAVAAWAAWSAQRQVDDALGAADAWLSLGGLVLAAVALNIMAPVPRPGPGFGNGALLVSVYVATPVLEVASVVAVLGTRRLRKFLATAYRLGPGFLRRVGMGVVGGTALLAAAAVITAVEAAWFRVRIASNNPFVYSPVFRGREPLLPALVLAMAIVVLAPVAEESLFRGLLFGGLANAYGFWPAAIVSGLLFGAAHLDLSLWAGLSVAGLWLDWLYWRYRSLWVSTAAHATLNGLSVLLAMAAR